ncbi:MAG: helix-turn-helix domain-containing protein [Acutalibacteraceae bacterium]|nr:helix-turn-helix domain-containing protein [Acutalibacteraceae bacterium]
MNTDFSRIITLLRKEKRLSQKQAASDLGISQALLSHYEKGIRECGLDFVIKIADYYNVSCDYLLGRSTERNGATITVENVEEHSSNSSVSYGNALAQLNKKLVQNSTNLIFDLAENTGDKNIEIAVSDYLMTSVYKMFRLLYSANPQNPQAIFSLPSELYGGYTSAFQSVKEAEATALTHGIAINEVHPLQKRENAPILSQEILSLKYPHYSASMLNIIKIVENSIKPL